MSETPINREQQGPGGEMLHARLAEDLEAMLASRQATEQHTATPEISADWMATAHGVMQHSLEVAKPNIPETMTGPTNPNLLATLQHGVIEKFRRADETVENLPDAVDRFGPEVMRRFVLDNIGEDPSTGVLYAGAIAMLTIPEGGYSGGRVPKLSKGRETPAQTLFRRATAYLREAADVDVRGVEMQEAASTGRLLAQQTKEALALHNADPDDLDKAADWESLRDRLERHSYGFKSAFIARYEAEALLSSLTQATFTAQPAAEEMRALERSYNEREAKRSQWHFLPPKPTGPRGPQAESGETDAGLDYDRQERIDELYSLVEQWGEGRVEESEFVSGSKRRYLAAILPQRLPDGSVIEHAVLDTARYANALFLLRADRPGEDLLEWPEVFDEEYKPEAEAKGAIRVIHRGDWRARVLDLLTRKPEELPSP